MAESPPFPPPALFTLFNSTGTHTRVTTTIAGRLTLRTPSQPLVLLTDVGIGTARIVTEIRSALAAAHQDAIVAFPTNVAIPIGEIRLRISLSVLVVVVLTDIGVCAAGKVAELGGAHGAMTARYPRRTSELTIFYASLSVLVLADLGVGTCWEVTGIRITLNGGAAVDTGRAVELTVGQRGFCWASLGGGVAVGAVGAVGKGTVAPAAYHLDAEFTWRTRDGT